VNELDDVQTTIGVIDGLRSRIAALEAENERLRVCGNCWAYGLAFSDCNDDPDEELPEGAEVEACGPCHFTPSRWTEKVATP